MSRSLVCFCCALALGTFSLFAISGTSQVAWAGKPVLADAGWPAGALELINDPARTEGWKPWFSGWASDVEHFLFKLSTSNDVNRLIERLAAIQTNVHLVLSAEREAGALGFTTVMKRGNGHGAVFSLGNQRVLNEYGGTNVSGERRTPSPAASATAHPPTLTLFVGDPMVDLNKLKVPRHVKVSAAVSAASAREGKAEDPEVRAIAEFLRTLAPSTGGQE